MKILGINDQHNASACLVVDGLVVAAVQEERFSRIKNEFCFPARAVAWCLASTGTRPDELDEVAIASEHIIGGFTGPDLVRSYARTNHPVTQLRRAARRTPLHAVRRRQRRQERLASVVDSGLPLDRTTFIEHHTAHAAAAYHGSPWKEDPVLVITCDGQGDGLSASVRIGERGRLSPELATVKAADSLGSVYATITALSGMIPLEHEYKLMGMAPFAPEPGGERSYRQFEGMFRFTDPGGMSWTRTKSVPSMEYAYPYFRKRLERHRFDWIAAGVQRFTEEHLARWIGNAIAETGVHKLALGGGVFMNVKANQRIYRLDEVEDLFIFPSCGDETNAMGAAFEAQATASVGTTEPVGIPALGHVYWGPGIEEVEVEALLPELARDGMHVQRHDDIEAAVVDLLVAGEVVARAKGRMEFGARALGNRSILADPTRPDVVRIINDMIKSRDFWMPFAPAILAEESDDYIDNPRGMVAPYMIMTFDSKRPEDFPAAIQPYDRTARPQIVYREHNPDLHRLISGFRDKTGRAVVLNTSFNLHGYPIVSSAADAVSVLRSSGLRHLAVGNHLISKA
ncbi:carbamoyltransferase C-terminal domain-containing protein [Nitriliruptor alkaliphilus]|uniref:carbamoyltransferase C-terminal domain-containing protein n=1 Tax=Nitriliruptor alkaliphilus TaxID=427918 RepID=UPI000695CF8E|nr:carbamoyltransferase C-terminal domain-containing protein [Nitriliruptor alkaliphilus]